jgi:hypothetical protein
LSHRAVRANPYVFNNLLCVRVSPYLAAVYGSVRYFTPLLELGISRIIRMFRDKTIHPHDLQKTPKLFTRCCLTHIDKKDMRSYFV